MLFFAIDPQAGVAAGLGRALLHEHRHQQLEQPQQGLDQGAGFLGHLAGGAQALEPSLEGVQFLARADLLTLLRLAIVRAPGSA